MSKKKTPDEFEAMRKLHDVLKPFDWEARLRMFNGACAKIEAEKPKKRVRNSKNAVTPDPRQAVIPGAELPSEVLQ